MSMRSCFIVIDAWLHQEPELTRKQILATKKLKPFAGYAQSTMDKTLRELKKMCIGRMGQTPREIHTYLGRQRWQ